MKRCDFKKNPKNAIKGFLYKYECQDVSTKRIKMRNAEQQSVLETTLRHQISDDV